MYKRNVSLNMTWITSLSPEALKKIAMKTWIHQWTNWLYCSSHVTDFPDIDTHWSVSLNIIQDTVIQTLLITANSILFWGTAAYQATTKQEIWAGQQRQRFSICWGKRWEESRDEIKVKKGEEKSVITHKIKATTATVSADSQYRCQILIQPNIHSWIPHAPYPYTNSIHIYGNRH